MADFFLPVLYCTLHLLLFPKRNRVKYMRNDSLNFAVGEE
jgi:hypothetical protein